MGFCIDVDIRFNGGRGKVGYLAEEKGGGVLVGVDRLVGGGIYDIKELCLR